MLSEISLFLTASVQEGKKSRLSCGAALCSTLVRHPGMLHPALGSLTEENETSWKPEEATRLEPLL